MRAAAENTRRPLRALVMDDGEADRTYLRALLHKKFGVSVTEVGNGLEGLQAIEAEMPDFVVLDVNMPVLSGSEVLEAIRQCPHYSHLPVIVLTAAKSKRMFEELMTFGVSDYILKPLDYELAMARFSHLIEQVRNARGMQRTNARAANRNRVLVASEDDRFLDLCREVLDKSFSVLTAQSGAEGLELFLQEHPQTVIIGENLPLLNEHMLAQKVRDIAGKNVRIILLGRNANGSFDRALFDGRLVQTLSPETLLERFNALSLDADPAKVTTERELRRRLSEELPQEMFKAVQQTIGVMAKTEVRIAAMDSARNLSLELEARAALTDKNSHVNATLCLITSRRDANNLASRVMNGVRLSLSECDELFGELVRTIGGKICAAFEHVGLTMAEVDSSVNTIDKTLSDYAADTIMAFQTDVDATVLMVLDVKVGA